MYDDDVDNTENLLYLLYKVFLIDDEPTIEDFILMLGTLVAFIAFILWCCFPVVPEYYSVLENDNEKVDSVFKEYQQRLIEKKKSEKF